jgi:hypothetical protein
MVKSAQKPVHIGQIALICGGGSSTNRGTKLVEHQNTAGVRVDLGLPYAALLSGRRAAKSPET